MNNCNINRVVLVGHVTQEPITRAIGDTRAISQFILATNGRRTGGDDHLNVEFHSIVCFDELAELCKEYIHKGRLVYVEGRLKTSRWEDDNQVLHSKTEIVATNIMLLDKTTALSMTAK